MAKISKEKAKDASLKILEKKLELLEKRRVAIAFKVKEEYLKTIPESIKKIYLSDDNHAKQFLSYASTVKINNLQGEPYYNRTVELGTAVACCSRVFEP